MMSDCASEDIADSVDGVMDVGNFDNPFTPVFNSPNKCIMATESLVLDCCCKCTFPSLLLFVLLARGSVLKKGSCGVEDSDLISAPVRYCSMKKNVI